MKRLIVLAAGTGSRLGTLTDSKPKCLQTISGKSILDWQIDVARSQGMEEIVVVRGHLAQHIRVEGVKYVENLEYAASNMLYSLWCARAHLMGEVIVSYGDIIFSPQVFKSISEAEEDMAIAIDLQWFSYWRQRFSDVLSDAESMELGEDGRIVSLGEKTRDLSRVQGQYIGLMKFSASGSESICTYLEKESSTMQSVVYGAAECSLKEAYMTDFLQHLINNGHRLTPVFIEGGWLEIDHASDLDLANELVHMEGGQFVITR
ncbi:MAG: NTP transferase domain-containing protein [Nitrospirales bacterium]